MTCNFLSSLPPFLPSFLRCECVCLWVCVASLSTLPAIRVMSFIKSVWKPSLLFSFFKCFGKIGINSFSECLEQFTRQVSSSGLCFLEEIFWLLIQFHFPVISVVSFLFPKFSVLVDCIFLKLSLFSRFVSLLVYMYLIFSLALCISVLIVVTYLLSFFILFEYCLFSLVYLKFYWLLFLSSQRTSS